MRTAIKENSNDGISTVLEGSLEVLPTIQSVRLGYSWLLCMLSFSFACPCNIGSQICHYESQLPAATSCYQLLALAQCNIHNIQTAYSNLNSNIHIVTLVWSYLLWWIRDTRDTDHPGHPKVPRAAKDSTGSPTW